MDQGVEPALQGQSILGHLAGLAERSVGGLEGQFHVFASDLGGEFEAGLAADDFGSKGFGVYTDLALGPGKGFADLTPGLPAVSFQMGSEKDDFSVV
jgi:hypothetical protein